MQPVDGGFRLGPPDARRALLVRTRLLARLRRRFTARVTVVVAPAGFGKTTMLAQAVADAGATAGTRDLWLTCTADDAAASSLAEGLCLALDVEPATPPAAAAAVAEAMWHLSPTQVALVLDDTHEVPAGSAGAALLEELVAALPRNGHLVLAGRTPPPVPLARLDVLGELERLGEDDLLFADDELAAFAARRGVPYEQVTASGGWPALAELSASAAPGVAADYLWEEVLSRLPPARRRALALVAHAGAGSDRVAAAAVGGDIDLDALTEGFPLATGASGARHIHPVWLPHLAEAVTPAEVAQARRRAGLALADSGEVAAGVRLLSQAEAWDDMARVVVDALGAARPPVPGDVAATWLGRLPAAMGGGPLALLLGAVAVMGDDPAGAAERLDRAAQAFRRDGDEAGELAAIAQIAHLAWWLDQPDRLVAVAARFLEMEASGNSQAFPFACLARALVADLANDGRATLAELDRIPGGALNESWTSLVDWMRAVTLGHLGRAREAMAAAERASKAAGPLYQPLVETTRLATVWMTGGMDEALAGMPALVDRSAAAGMSDYTAVVAATHATLLAVAGRIGEAERALERATAFATSPVMPLVDVNVTHAEATIRAGTGDEAGATELLRRYLERAGPVGTGLGAFAQQRALTLWYVLVPETRPAWDAADLGPYVADARALARALVAVRSGGRAPSRATGRLEPGLVRAVLPLPWAVELALARVGAGDQGGWHLLDALWPAARPHVRAHADDPGSHLRRPARAARARLPVPPDGRLELRLLGPVELSRDGEPVDAPEWRRRRVRAVLAHLVLHRPDTRERLGADLWPDLDTEAQARNLRVTLTHLLRALEPGRGDRDAAFLVRPHGGELRLHRGDWFDTDVWRFDDLSRQALDADRRGEPSAALGPMLDAVALWRGDPGELAAEEWALPAVEERRARLATLATRAGELLLAHEGAERAAALAEVALGVDPWSDRAHRLVVQAHTAAGDHSAARRALDRYRQALADVGVRPDEASRTLDAVAGSARPAGPADPAA